MTNSLSIAAHAFASHVLMPIFRRWSTASEVGELVPLYQSTTIYQVIVVSLIKRYVHHFVCVHIEAYAISC